MVEVTPPFLYYINMTADKLKRLDRYFMNMALTTSTMSYATRAKVGSVLAFDNRIIATGWNGQPSGMDNVCEYVDESGKLCTLPTVIHAEANLLSYCAKYGIKTNNSTLYVTLSPCVNCALLILQAGIKRVVYNDVYRNIDGIILLKQHNVECVNINEEY